MKCPCSCPGTCGFHVEPQQWNFCEIHDQHDRILVSLKHLIYSVLIDSLTELKNSICIRNYLYVISLGFVCYGCTYSIIPSTSLILSANKIYMHK
uniref:BC2 n=1 Tax=Mungbean yellow mosaic virus TaxID=33726 RepID=Q0GGQ9_9GEMI|nr:BC2 [Mungbean yellow mosaic virus]